MSGANYFIENLPKNDALWDSNPRPTAYEDKSLRLRQARRFQKAEKFLIIVPNFNNITTIQLLEILLNKYLTILPKVVFY